MRIYTNYDGWKMSVHRVLMGWVNYQGVKFDLDVKKDRLSLIQSLKADHIIKPIEASEEHGAIYGHTYQIMHPDYKFLNKKADGEVNNMQEKALLMNLKENTSLFTKS